MARGKYLSLEEARKAKKLDRFAKEHPSEADERFWPLLDAAIKGSLEAEQTSGRDASANYSGTRTRPSKKEDT